MAEKEWLCQNRKCRAKLGVISWNGSKVPTLMLLRHSIDMNIDQPTEVDVLGPLVGQMPVKCECCDEISFWEISVDALIELIGGLRQEQLDQLEIRLSKGRVKPVRSRAPFE